MGIDAIFLILSMVGISLIAYSVFYLADNLTLKNKIVVGAMMFGASLLILSVNIFARHEIYKKLAKEVGLKQVTMQGENHFEAKVLIIYKDGQLDSVALVPGTTAAAKK